MYVHAYILYVNNTILTEIFILKLNFLIMFYKIHSERFQPKLVKYMTVEDTVKFYLFFDKRVIERYIRKLMISLGFREWRFVSASEQ